MPSTLAYLCQIWGGVGLVLVWLNWLLPVASQWILFFFFFIHLFQNCMLDFWSSTITREFLKIICKLRNNEWSSYSLKKVSCLFSNSHWGHNFCIGCQILNWCLISRTSFFYKMNTMKSRQAYALHPIFYMCLAIQTTCFLECVKQWFFEIFLIFLILEI